MVIAALISGIGAYATNYKAKLAPLYYSNANQTWSGAGEPAPDQNQSNYHLIAEPYRCSISTTIACSYELVDNEYVFSNDKGENSLSTN